MKSRVYTEIKCCKGGSYAGHAYFCSQPGYDGPPPLPGHALCYHGRVGGSYCWRGHAPSAALARLEGGE